MVTVGGLLDTVHLSDESARISSGQSVTQERYKPNDSLTKDMAGSVTAHAPLLCCQDLDHSIQALLTTHEC